MRQSKNNDRTRGETGETPSRKVREKKISEKTAKRGKNLKKKRSGQKRKIGGRRPYIGRKNAA